MVFITSYEIQKGINTYAYYFSKNDEGQYVVEIYKNGSKYDIRRPSTKQEIIDKYSKHFPDLVNKL